jgi:fructose-bisphosphate aldolase class II
MNTLLDLLRDATLRHVAIGHFNISELVAFQAVVAAARELRVPVLVGVSEGERRFLGVPQAVALVRSVREQSGLPIFLNADHTHSLAKAEEAARAGFDEILFDGSSLPFEENVRETKKAVEAIKSIAPSIVVEGEVGYIGSSSEILSEVPKGMQPLTTPQEAAHFVKETCIDVLAPAVGNMHGMLASMLQGQGEKRLDLRHIKEIKNATSAYLTLHGGSGTNNDDLRGAIAAGITIIHINTELRVAWRRGLEAGLAKDPSAVAPYKILPTAVESVKQVVLSRLQLFNAPQQSSAAS